MRQKARSVARDRIFVLTDREPASDVIDEPASEHRISAGKIRQRRERLADEALGAIGSLLLGYDIAVTHDGDIGAFARLQRFAHKGGAEAFGARLILEEGR